MRTRGSIIRATFKRESSRQGAPNCLQSVDCVGTMFFGHKTLEKYENNGMMHTWFKETINQRNASVFVHTVF